MQQQLPVEQIILTMTTADVLHMNNGDDDSSYARNSLFQRIVIQKATPVLKGAIKSMVNHDVIFDHCFMIADLGCSSGMNTLLVTSNIIDAVDEVCQENNRKTPQFQVCLNDLFENDFNNLFKLLPDFHKKLKKKKGENFGPCFFSAVPGSFYDRLFPDESLHLVHSSYSIHWLSKVPKGLENNKLNIYVAKTSPLNAVQAYVKQFDTDFTKFLQLRSKEIVRGGHMVLTLRGRSTLDPTDDCDSLWDLLTLSLLDMLKEGLVRESDINSFNLPFYCPHEDELRNIIQENGSFSLNHINTFEFDWDQHDTGYKAKMLRAVAEPLFTCHFGKSIIDVLFNKFEKNVTEHLATKDTRHISIVMSLTKM